MIRVSSDGRGLDARCHGIVSQCLAFVLLAACVLPASNSFGQDRQVSADNSVLWIYRDVPAAGQPDTRTEVERMFQPFGYMPAERATQIVVNPSRPVDRSDPRKGTCIEYYCEFKNLMDWMGSYTLIDGNAWGTKAGINVPERLNIDARTPVALRFRARGEGAVTFKIGGVTDGPHPSSLRLARQGKESPTRLTAGFQDYTIGPIEAGELVNLIDPFCMVTSAVDNRGRNAIRVEVDDIRLELFDPPQSSAAALPTGWRGRLMQTCFVAYTPTGFDPTVQPPREPSRENMQADLAAIARLLTSAGIADNRRGIMTYGCRDGLEKIAPLARQAGLSVILGIFNPRDALEINNAEQLLKREELTDTIVACCVGNEAITFRRGTMEDIQEVVTRLQRSRRLPMTTTEIVQAYGDKRLFAMDFTLANAHALFGGIRESDQAAKWAVARIQDLLATAPKDHLIVIKEIGWPAGPEPTFTGDQQAAYWKAVLTDPVSRRVNVCIFDGLSNVPWKEEPVTTIDGAKVNVGPYWPVLFDQERRPRPYAQNVLELWLATRRTER